MFKSERRITFDYIKSIITSLFLPIGYLILWYYFYPATWRELQLLTHNTKTINGYVTHAEEMEDYVETNNDSKIERKLDFAFEYFLHSLMASPLLHLEVNPVLYQKSYKTLPRKRNKLR